MKTPKGKPVRTNSSAGKSINKRMQRAEAKVVNDIMKYGSNSKKVSKASAKVVKIKKRKYGST